MTTLKKGKKSAKRVQLTDSEFAKRLLELDSCKAKLARELGVSRAAVQQRAAKLATLIEEMREAMESGPVALIVAQAEKKIQAKADAVTSGAEKFSRQYHIFDHLEDLYIDIKMLLDEVKSEIADNKAKSRPLRPRHVDQVVKLVNQARGLITDAQDMKMQLAQAKNVETYIQAMTHIVMKYDPEIKGKIYAELAGLGLEGQTAFLTPCSRPRPRGVGDT